MSKKTMKILSVLLIAVVLLSVTASSVFAVDVKMFDKQTDDQLTKTTTNVATSIVSVIRIVAFAAAVIILLIVAIKYMTAAPSDKAEIKKHMLVYVIGAIILLAASGILTFIQTMATTWFPAN